MRRRTMPERCTMRAPRAECKTRAPRDDKSESGAFLLIGSFMSRRDVSLCLSFLLPFVYPSFAFLIRRNKRRAGIVWRISCFGRNIFLRQIFSRNCWIIYRHISVSSVILLISRLLDAFSRSYFYYVCLTLFLSRARASEILTREINLIRTKIQFDSSIFPEKEKQARTSRKTRHT